MKKMFILLFFLITILPAYSFNFDAYKTDNNYICLSIIFTHAAGYDENNIYKTASVFEELKLIIDEKNGIIYEEGGGEPWAKIIYNRDYELEASMQQKDSYHEIYFDKMSGACIWGLYLGSKYTAADKPKETYYGIFKVINPNNPYMF